MMGVGDGEKLKKVIIRSDIRTRHAKQPGIVFSIYSKTEII